MYSVHAFGYLQAMKVMVKWLSASVTVFHLNGHVVFLLIMKGSQPLRAKTWQGAKLQIL